MSVFWSLWLGVAVLLAAVVHLCVLGLDGVSLFARYLRRWLRLLALLLATLLGSLGLRAFGAERAPVALLVGSGGIAIVCLLAAAWPWWRRRLHRRADRFDFGR
jgi:Mn2+/Fe2+ NRAMP family transporter